MSRPKEAKNIVWPSSSPLAPFAGSGAPHPYPVPKVDNCPRRGTLSYSTPLTSAGAPFCETMRIERRRSKTWQTCLDSAAARSSGVRARPITNLQALQTESIVPSQIHRREYGRRSYNCNLDFGTKRLTMVSAMACCRQLASVLSVRTKPLARRTLPRG